MYSLAACDWSKQNDGVTPLQVFVNKRSHIEFTTEKAEQKLISAFYFRSLNLQIDNLTRASKNLASVYAFLTHA